MIINSSGYSSIAISYRLVPCMIRKVIPTQQLLRNCNITVHYYDVLFEQSLHWLIRLVYFLLTRSKKWMDFLGLYYTNFFSCTEITISIPGNAINPYQHSPNANKIQESNTRSSSGGDRIPRESIALLHTPAHPPVVVDRVPLKGFFPDQLGDHPELRFFLVGL